MSVSLWCDKSMKIKPFIRIYAFLYWYGYKWYFILFSCSITGYRCYSSNDFVKLLEVGGG